MGDEPMPSDPRVGAPDTSSCDYSHRPGVLERWMMKGYNDRCDESSSSFIAKCRADVGRDPGNSLRHARRQPHASRARVLSPHG